MTVLVILGILAAVGVSGFTKYVRSARKSSVVSNLSAITLRQKNFFAVTGHYASSTADEDELYPAKTAISNADLVPVKWVINDDAYTGAKLSDDTLSRGGPAVHGFDALRFMPEGAQSYCGYGTISGWGSNAPQAAPPATAPIADAVFPNTTAEEQRFFANDWFYSFAICDFDFDSNYSAFTTAHYTSEVSGESLGTTYTEGE